MSDEPPPFWFELACDLDSKQFGQIPTCVGFDLVHDAVLVGWADGMLSTYDVFELGSPYTSFKAHPSPIKQITSLGVSGILSVSRHHVCIHSLGGAPYVSSSLLDKEPSSSFSSISKSTSLTPPLSPSSSQASSLTSSTSLSHTTKELTSTLVLNSSRIVVGCSEPTNGSALYELDLSRLEECESTRAMRYVHKFRGGAYNHGVSLLCPTATGAILCGGTDGRVGMLDLRQSRAAATPVLAHAGGLSDFDLFDTTLVTCGHLGEGRTDPFVKVFDIRMLTRPLGVLQMDASFIRFLPGYHARAMIVGAMGNVEVYYDLDQASAAKVEQMERVQSGGGAIAGMAVSAVGRAATFVDTAGYLHLWTDDETWVDTPNHNVNAFPEPLEELPQSSFAASEKQMSSLEFWKDDLSDLAFQSAFMPELFQKDDTDPHFGPHCSVLPPLLMNKLVVDKNVRQIHPDLLNRAQTKQDFPGQYIDTRSDEFIMNHAMLFGKETAKRTYITEGANVSAAEERQAPNSPRSGYGATGRKDSGEEGASLSALDPGVVTDYEKSMEKLQAAIPEKYRQPVLKLGNLGLVDFDFGEFNDTPFAGLEATVPNAFTNSILQALYFIPELRNMLIGFEVEDGNCLATEAGFLFRMMNQSWQVESKSKSCIARNFLRAFRLAPDAQALGLLEPTQLEPDERAGAFVRFLLEQFSRSNKALKQSIARRFGVSFVHREKWLSHNIQDSFRKSTSLVLDMFYPNELSKAILHDNKVPNYSFCDLLQLTFAQSKRTKLWSKDHNEQVPVVQSKTTTGFSDYLILNAASHDNRSVYLPLYRQKDSATKKGKKEAGDDKQKEKDKDKTFVPVSFTVKIDPSIKKEGAFKGKTSHAVSVVEGMVPTASGSAGPEEVHSFELVAVVSHIYPSNNLVVHIKVPAEYANQASAEAKQSKAFAGNPVEPDSWLLFNDFGVYRVLDEKEVTDFRATWRNPCTFVYKRTSGPPNSNNHNNNKGGRKAGNEDADLLVAKEKKRLSDEKLFNAPSLALKSALRKTFTQLPVEKLPKKGDLVAIDCEMVALSTEESFVNEEGRKVVTRQAQLSLARLSCTLEDETVFIDDYIFTPEIVADFLTRFSGLLPGDLDPTTSRHHLVPLRIAYMKLLRLVERGCIFVGHGLLKDFRVINIHVPPEQILDTVHLFHLKNNRFLSLSFLASYLLKLDIQGKTHDSIEDARTALRLLKVYRTLQAQGGLETALTEIYEQGRLRNFQ